MDEEKKQNTAAHKHKMFSQSLKPEEYQRLVRFFANEVPKLSLKMCQIKEFPAVDKLVKQALYKNVKLGSSTGFNLKTAFPKLNKKH